VAVISSRWAGRGAELLGEFVPLGFLDLAGPDTSAHVVGLVGDDEIPVDLRRAVTEIGVAGQVVEPGDPEVAFLEGVVDGIYQVAC